jgi:hypothetical protein
MYIQMMAAGQPRKNFLMPENIFKRENVEFRHWDKRQALAGELKKWQLFFKDEQDKLMRARIRRVSANQGQHILGNAV